MSILLDSYRPLEILLSAFFFFRFVLLPVLLTGLDFSVLLQTFPFYMVFGYYLSFFFTISHNFEGVHKLEDTTRASNATSGSFLVNQVRFSAHKSIILYIYFTPKKIEASVSSLEFNKNVSSVKLMLTSNKQQRAVPRNDARYIFILDSDHQIEYLQIDDFLAQMDDRFRGKPEISYA